MRRFKCPCPDNECHGDVTTINASIRYTKSHPTSEDAFNCYAAYLIRQGYTRIGGREFAAPNDGPVQVLCKKSKFGAPLRQGKNVDGKGKRFVPKRGHRIFGGTIVST